VVYPDCYCFLEGGERIKMLRVRVCEESAHPGQVIHPKNFRLPAAKVLLKPLNLQIQKVKKLALKTL